MPTSAARGCANATRTESSGNPMAYKFKPNKSMAKRFKVSKTGKLKRHHSNTSHLMSARPANKRRKLRKSAVLFEGLARNMRKLMGVDYLNPIKAVHDKKVAKLAASKAARAAKAEATGKPEVKKPRSATKARAKAAATAAK